MANKITYNNKAPMQDNPEIPVENKATAEDFNEIKEVVNNNADELNTANENIKKLQNGQGTSNTEITNLKNKVQTLENDNATNKANISTLQEDNNTNKNNITNLQNNKVDKEEGKGLSTNDFTNEEKEKLAGLNNYDDTEIIDLLPKVSNKGESITLENTARAKFTKFRIEGNSKQKTRSGKNKVDFINYVETIFDSSKVEKLSDGSYKFKHCDTTYTLFEGLLKAPCTLSWYARNDGTTTTGAPTFNFKIFYEDGTAETLSYTTSPDFSLKTKVLTKNVIKIVNSYIGTSPLTIIKDVQLEKGSKATEYEQYGAMPSEEFPSEIKNVKENVRINIRNKNFCDLDILEKLKEGAITINSSNSFTINLENGRMKITSRINIMLPDGIDKSKKYRIKYHRKMNNVSFLPRLSALYVDGSKEEVEDRVLEADYEYVTSGKELSGMTVSWNTQDQGGIVTFSNISITEINENSDFEESKKQTIIFPFKQGQKLMQEDYLADDEIHHTKTQIQLDGVTNGLKVSNVTKHSNDIYYCVINLVKQSLNNTTDVSSMYCSHFMPHFEVKPGSCYIAGSGLYLVLVLTDQTITTVDAANTWLATQKEKGTPVVIEYKLAEEVVEPYTEVQKEAYEQIKNAISYKGQTNIFSTNEIKPIFEVEALADIGLLLNNMQAQILAGGE